jgi:hypothetical protein
MTARRGRGLSDRERRQMAAGRLMENAPPGVRDAMVVVMGALADMDGGHCGICCAELGDPVMACASLDGSRTVLTFQVICELHSAEHDPTWVLRSEALVN